MRTGFFRATGGLQVVGAENVPLEGPLIVAPNHLSHLDPPVVACAIPRQLTFMAKEELFRVSWFSKLIRSLGAFPVRRGQADTEAIRVALSLLEEGRALLVFPEGTRGDGRQLLPVNRGVALLAKRSGAPVLPVAIAGAEKKWPRGAKLPRWGRMTISFGTPLIFSEFEERFGGEKAARGSFGVEIERQIHQMAHTAGYPVLASDETLARK